MTNAPGSTPPESIRNFCIIAHIDHGKSTLADRMLQITEVVDARQMRAQYLDRMDIERERGITVKSQAVRMPWTARSGAAEGQGFVLNMIDTPGHVDFTYEVSRSLAACEGAILLVDAAQGIEAQTLANLYLAMSNDLTIIPVLNKIDLPSADPDRYAEEIAHLIGCEPEDVFRVSGKTGVGVAELLDAVVEQIPAPTGDADAPARAMIFDSVYDVYRGVVTYIRVVDGKLNAREQDPHDVDPGRPRAPRDRRDQPRAGGLQGPQRGRGGLPDHRREGRAPVEGRRHGHAQQEARDRGSARVHRGQADGLLRALPDRRLRLREPPRGPRQAAAQRRRAPVRARDVCGARLRLPRRLPRPAALGDHPGAPRTRVQPRPDLDRAERGLPGRSRRTASTSRSRTPRSSPRARSTRSPSRSPRPPS